jgi:hypothetical protein
MSELLTISEVAEILGVSKDTATRRFQKVKGVIDLGSAETQKRRRYRVLRVPTSVVERYVRERGGRITVPAPEKSAKLPVRVVRPPTEDSLIRDLATLTTLSGESSRRVLERIARRARVLTHVPKDQWQDVVWFDEDEDAEG